MNQNPGAYRTSRRSLKRVVASSQVERVNALQGPVFQQVDGAVCGGVAPCQLRVIYVSRVVKPFGAYRPLVQPPSPQRRGCAFSNSQHSRFLKLSSAMFRQRIRAVSLVVVKG